MEPELVEMVQQYENRRNPYCKSFSESIRMAETGRFKEMDDIELKRMGKYVSMLLRHDPEEAGIVIDEHGWTDVMDLINKMSPKYPMTEDLHHQIAFGLF